PWLMRGLDDERWFAGPDQTELFACDGLDRAGIFVQMADVVAQLGVLLSENGERRGEVRVLAPRPDRLHQSLVSDQGIHHEHDRHECKNVIEQSPTDRRLLRAS